MLPMLPLPMLPMCISQRDDLGNATASAASQDTESEKPKKLSAEERAKAAQTLDKHLGPLSYLFTSLGSLGLVARFHCCWDEVANHAIHKFFRKFARAKTLDGRKAITPQQVAQMAPHLAEHLEVPPVLFKQVDVLCQRFDFDGSGVLDRKQNILRHKRKQLGPRRLPVDVPEMSLASSGYVVHRELGRGGQGAQSIEVAFQASFRGVMYLCTLEEVPYCIKFFSKADGDEDCLEDLLTEYTLMKDFSHQNVAKTFEVFQDSEFFYLVNEPYFGGDLTKLGKRAHDQGLAMSEHWWRLIFQQCLEGLEYLHSQAAAWMASSVMHCDIKEENIMVAGADCEEPRLVLIDFGLAEGFLSTSSGCSGTAGYIPPETWETERWYPKGHVSTSYKLESPNKLGVDKGAQWRSFGNLADLWQERTGRLIRPATWVNSRTGGTTSKGKHEWFFCDSDEDFPAENRAALIGSSASQSLREQVTYELASKNNLHDLRELKESLEDLSRRIKKPNVAAKDSVIEVLIDYGVRRGCAREYAAVCGADGFLDFSLYTSQFLQDLFLELDYDEQGQLSRRQLESLLKCGAVECDSDEVEEMLDAVEFNESGYVDVGTVRALMLKDGRIARRTQDHRRRNCHCEPARWVVDEHLRAAVPDFVVEQRLRAERGETRTHPDKDILDILFSDNVKPQKATFKELNVDLSCIDLPVQEGGPVRARHQYVERKNFMPEPIPPPEEVEEEERRSGWNWCKEGRKLLDTSGDWTEEKAALHRSQSLPQALGGASLLPGANGVPASPFHGMATRRFGEDSGWDGRMRGSLLARRGWAGTAPDKERGFEKPRFNMVTCEDVTLEFSGVDMSVEVMEAALEERRALPKYSELATKREALPAFKQREQVISTVKENQVVLLSGETGCGKSTQVPQLILDAAPEDWPRLDTPPIGH
eukprot:s2085_g17.t1